MKSIYPIIAGSNQPLEITLTDALTEEPINLTGCTAWSATARETSTGAQVALSYCAPVSPATSGVIKLEWLPGDFATPGLYAVQLKCTDATGHTLIMPSEAGQLLMRVGVRHD